MELVNETHEHNQTILLLLEIQINSDTELLSIKQFLLEECINVNLNDLH